MQDEAYIRQQECMICIDKQYRNHSIYAEWVVSVYNYIYMMHSSLHW